MSTPPLKTQIIDSIRRISTFFLISLSFLNGICIIFYYLYLREKSNQGYLQEMTCQKLEKYFVNCRLEETDIEGNKKTLFSEPIKSATHSVLTTDVDVYTCSVSLVTRKGQKIDVDFLTSIESSKDCPTAKGIVNQINQYILGGGKQPLYWSRDQRVGDLTKNLFRDPGLINILFYISVGCGAVSLLRLSIMLLTFLFSTPEQFWQIDTRFSSIKVKRAGLLFKSERNFSLRSLEAIQFYSNLEQATISIREAPDKNYYIHFSMNFCSPEDKMKVVKFLENATDIKAEETYYYDDDDD